jgi:hypothetical protein
VGVRDVVGRDPLGLWCLGITLPLSLSALAPSERYAAKRGERHKKITEWAWQLLLQVRRWYPQRENRSGGGWRLRLPQAPRSLPKLEQARVAFITRLRLDAALYEPAPARRPGQIGRPRLKGERLPNLSVVAEAANTVWKLTTITNWYGERERMVEIASETAVWYSTGLFAVPVRWVLIRDPRGEFKTQALLCTDLGADPQKILSWFVMRWQLEVTLQEMRRHLGFETQRQWSDLAIRRTTPALLGLLSLITLFAHGLMAQAAGRLSASGLVPQELSDLCRCACAGAQGELWAQETFRESSWQTDTVKVPRAFMERLTDTLCYAA